MADICIRDWAPFTMAPDTFVKAKYDPAYYALDEKEYSARDDRASSALIEYLGGEVTLLESRTHNIILDGGNFTHNGNGVGVVSNRIISDNESVLITDYRRVFRARMGISRLITVPVDPGDVTGHVDGMVRFIDPVTMVLGTYGDAYKEGTKFLNQLSKQFENKYNVIRIINAVADEPKAGEMASAFGNYINFFRVGNTIFLPQYDLPEDEKALKMFETQFKVVPIKMDVKKLADLGGVLNCISWLYY